MTLRELIIKIGADTKDYDRKLVAATTQIKKFGEDAANVGQRLTLGVTLPLAGVGAMALKTAGELEQNSIAFKTMMGSAVSAQKHLDELKRFALQTPFEFKDLVLASKRMQALGFDAKEVIPSLRNIGDAASALGMGAEGIQRITTALGQMKAKGTVQAEEMRQLAEAGIPAWQILAKTLNTTVADAMKQVEKRTVDAATAVPALLAGMNAKFGGLMAEQSKTLIGQFSNLKDAIGFVLADVGKAMAPTAKSMMENVIQPMLNKVKELAHGFASLPEPVRNFAVSMTGAAAVLPVVVWALGSMITNLSLIGGWLVKIAPLLTVATAGWAALAAAVAAAGVAFVQYRSAASDAEAMDKKAGQSLLELETSLRQRGASFENLRKEYNSGVISQAEYMRGLLKVAQALGPTAEGAKSVAAAHKLTKEELQKLADIQNRYLDAQDAMNERYRRQFEEMGRLNPLVRQGALDASDYSRGIDAVAQALYNVAHAGQPGYTTLVQFGEIVRTDTVALYDYNRELERLKNGFPTPEQMSVDWTKAGRGTALETITNPESQTSHRAAAEAAKQEAQRVRDMWQQGTASQLDYERAQKAATEAERKADDVGKSHTKTVNEFGKEVQKAFQHMSRGIADAIVEWKGFGQTAISVVKDLAKGILEIFINKALKKLAETLLDLSGIMGKVFGGAASGAAGAGGSVAGSAASGGGSAAGGAVGAGAVGLAGTVTAVAGVVSAVSSVIGNFQMAGMNKTLDLIENYTRYAKIYLGEQSDSILNSLHIIRNVATDSVANYWGTTVPLWTRMLTELENGGGSKSGGGGGGGGASFYFQHCTFGAGLTQAGVTDFMRVAFAQAQAAAGR